MSLSIGISSGGIGCHGGCDHWMGTVDTGYWLYEYVQSWRRPLCGNRLRSQMLSAFHLLMPKRRSDEILVNMPMKW